MANSIRCALGLFLFPLEVWALAWPGPEPTPGGEANLAVWGRSPAPTAGAMEARGVLEERETTGTCGYISADYSSALTCPPSNYCVYNTMYDAAWCCSMSDIYDCIAPTTCVGYYESCGSECEMDSRTAKCMDSSFPYCVTATWAVGSDYTMYKCGATSTPYNLAVFDDWTTIQHPSSTPVYPSSSASISNGIVSSFASSSDSTPSSSLTAANNAKSEDDDDDDDATPVGAIVGGVVGGVSGLVLIGAAAFILLHRHHRKQQSQSHGSEPPAPPYDGPPPELGAPVPPAGPVPPMASPYGGQPVPVAPRAYQPVAPPPPSSPPPPPSPPPPVVSAGAGPAPGKPGFNVISAEEALGLARPPSAYSAGVPPPQQQQYAVYTPPPMMQQYNSSPPPPPPVAMTSEVQHDGRHTEDDGGWR